MGTGAHVLIGGFIISGDVPKKVIVRAVGPSLANYGVPDVLNDPELQLFSASTSIAANNNWQDTDPAAIAATGLQPSDPRESALIAILAPGAYTAIERGVDGGQGVGLVEVYDIERSSHSTLTNISTRSVVEAGANVMIGGIIVGGEDAGSFLIRALGPSLAAFGIPDPLPNPVLELHDSNGALLAFNDDWRDSQEAEMQASGLAPGDEREAAISRTLPPGSYTAIVRSISPDATGVALVEIYRR